MTPSITSDEVNFLVYRYLQESGYNHAGFTFAYESSVAQSNINGDHVPPGALISFLQKGLQYAEIETHLKQDGSEIECDSPFSLVYSHACHQPAKSSDRRKKSYQNDDRMEDGDQTLVNTEAAEHVNVGNDAVTTLRGHSSEVFVCQWNPVQNMLASGSGDATARIWTIPEGSCGAGMGDKVEMQSFAHEKDVTTLDWSFDGSLLATGSYDGQARIWTAQGQRKFTLEMHRGPIFSLKWNKRGDLLLSGSVDKTAIVWDARHGTVKQKFDFHSEATLDVDWRNNASFASCSTDRMIYVCKLGENKPIKSFSGHTDEVNAIKWDPTGTLLASCSDDFTAKVWNLKQDTCVHDFTEHSKEIYTIKWSPAASGPRLLASASFDATVKLWDVEAGVCVRTLALHTDPVYSVAFSPDGNYIASGSFDKSLRIWSVRDGCVVRTFHGDSGIFEVSWNSTGDKVAACFSDSSLCVLDFKMNQPLEPPASSR
eukprot:Rmarinus@m.17192